MIKFRLYLDKDKETIWLNKMAENGYAMNRFFAGFYNFDTCTPGKYTYQIDFGDRFFSVSEDYRDFMNENDIQILQTWGYWIFLRKYTAKGPFVLYTDVDSSIEHYTKIRNMFKAVAILELICFFIECLAFYKSGGSPLVFSFVILAGLFAFVIMQAAIRTNHIIEQLKERKGEFSEKPNNQMSPVMLLGFFINMFVLTTKDMLSPYVEIPLLLFAIGFMIYGMVDTARKNKL